MQDLRKKGRLFATYSVSLDHFLLDGLGSSWAKLAKNDILSVCNALIMNACMWSKGPSIKDVIVFSEFLTHPCPDNLWTQQMPFLSGFDYVNKINCYVRGCVLNLWLLHEILKYLCFFNIINPRKRKKEQ